MLRRKRPTDGLRMAVITAGILLACQVPARAEVEVETVPVYTDVERPCKPIFSNCTSIGLNPDPSQQRGECFNGTGYGPWNPCCGKLAKPFLIGKYEVTCGQYYEFLEAVMPVEDVYYRILYGAPFDHLESRCGIKADGIRQHDGSWIYFFEMIDETNKDHPVTFVSYWAACMFVNWLHNGQGPHLSLALSGSYKFHDPDNPVGDLETLSRSEGATYVIPTEDEWFKAAHWDKDPAPPDPIDPGGQNRNGFWKYPTNSDSISCGSANIFQCGLGIRNVGYGDPSPFDAYNMAGNVFEWTETAVSVSDQAGGWVLAQTLGGGCFQCQVGHCYADHWAKRATRERDVGFRVARPLRKVIDVTPPMAYYPTVAQGEELDPDEIEVFATWDEENDFLLPVSVPLPYTVAFDTAGGGRWMSVSPLTGVLDTCVVVSKDTLSVSYDTADLDPGGYSGLITVSTVYKGRPIVRFIRVHLTVVPPGCEVPPVTAGRAVSSVATEGPCGTDLAAKIYDINQVIQPVPGVPNMVPFPLVHGKATAVRAKVGWADGSDKSEGPHLVALNVYSAETGELLQTIAKRVVFDEYLSEALHPGNLWDTVDLVFMPPEEATTFHLEVAVTGLGDELEPPDKMANNKDRRENVTFERKGVPSIAYIGVDYRLNEGDPTNTPGDAISEGAGFLAQIMPVPSVKYWLIPSFNHRDWNLDVRNDAHRKKMALLLEEWRLKQPPSRRPDYAVAWLPKTGEYNWVGYVEDFFDRVAIVVEQETSLRQQKVFAHELGHCFGIRHAVPKKKYRERGDGTIEASVTISGLGVWPRLNPASISSKYQPKDISIMWWDPLRGDWIDIRSYKHMLSSERVPWNKATGGSAAPSSEGQPLWVTGRFDPQSVSAETYGAHLLPHTADVTESNPDGDLIVRAYHLDPEPHALYDIRIMSRSPYGSGQDVGSNAVGVVIPADGGNPLRSVDRIDFVLASTGEVLTAKSRSASAPEIAFISPQPGDWLTEGKVIQWTGSDADGNDLTYSLLYSWDSGETFIPLVVGATETEYVFSCAGLPGGDPNAAALMLTANDGFNTVSVQTASLTQPLKQTPYVTLMSPEDGQSVLSGQAILLSAYVYDAEDGDLPDASIVWSSDLDGTLGMGGTLLLSTLTIGTHFLTVTATDSDGMVGSEGVTVHVHDRTIDTDDDGVPDGVDNCPDTANPDQGDADEDGLGDACDDCTDTDGDAYGDPGFGADTCPTDNCPFIPNTNDEDTDCNGDGEIGPGEHEGEQCDSDGDGMGDACDCGDGDIDADRDSVCDDDDLCPATLFGRDVDSNGCSDFQVDTDGDGICTNYAPGAGPSGCVLDHDGGDRCPGTDYGHTVDTCGCSDAQVDPDGDGVCIADAPCPGPSGCLPPVDLCPNDPDKTHPGQCGCGNADTDGDSDGVANCNDLCSGTTADEPVDVNGCADYQVDGDSDGICEDTAPLSEGPSGCRFDGDCRDLCPNTPAGVPVDACGCSDAQRDTDGDGYCNASFPSTGPGACVTGPVVCSGGNTSNCYDNCVDVPNGMVQGDSFQADFDGDGIGDACDEDIDGDWIPENFDGLGQPGENPCTNGAVADCDDNCPWLANPVQEDDDGDGIGNACDCGLDDEDGDNVCNGADLCPDTPGGQAVDVNGCADSQVDEDGDGICNDVDITGSPPPSEGPSGCRLDGDCLDLCPNTPAGELVDDCGCSEGQTSAGIDNDPPRRIDRKKKSRNRIRR